MTMATEKTQIIETLFREVELAGTVFTVHWTGRTTRRQIYRINGRQVTIRTWRARYFEASAAAETV